MKTIVCYIETGYGFKAPAIAIHKELISRGIDAELVDFFKAIGAPWWDAWICWSWRTMLKHPVLFNLVFPVTNTWVMDVLMFFVQIILYKRTKKFLDTKNPDFVISTHFISSYLLSKMNLTLEKEYPLYGYNSDVILSHRAYVNKNAHKYYIATAQGKNEMVKQGMPADKIELCGFPLDAKYKKVFLSVEEERKTLGLANMFTLVMTFGGEGIGNWSLVSDIAKAALPVQIVAICGKNEAVKKDLERIQKSYPSLVLHIKGFVNNLQDYLYVCDLSAGKAGLNVIFESIYMKKPFLTLKAMANEKYSAKYVEENSFGFKPKNNKEILSIVKGALSKDERYLKVQKTLETPPCSFNLDSMLDSIVKDVKKV